MSFTKFSFYVDLIVNYYDMFFLDLAEYMVL